MPGGKSRANPKTCFFARWQILLVFFLAMRQARSEVLHIALLVCAQPRMISWISFQILRCSFHRRIAENGQDSSLSPAWRSPCKAFWYASSPLGSLSTGRRPFELCTFKIVLVLFFLSEILSNLQPIPPHAPRSRLASCISFCIIVTRFACIAHRFVSSKRCTRKASLASCNAMIA